MAKVIRANYRFSKKQLETLNIELQKISKNTVKGLNGAFIPTRENYIDIDILSHPETTDIYLSYCDVSIAEQPTFVLKSIDKGGNVANPKEVLQFDDLYARIDFFSKFKTIETR